LPAAAHLRAGLQAEPAVAGAVAEQLRVDAVDVLRLVAADQGLLDPVVGGPGGEEDAVEKQGDVRLADDLVVQEQVPELPGALGVVDGVVEAEFLQQAALAPAGPALVAAGADDVHLDLAAGVAPQARAVLDEDDLRPVAGRGERGADAGEAAPGDEDVA